jgi:hypothetical protein
MTSKTKKENIMSISVAGYDMAHTCNPHIWEAEAGDSLAPGQPDYIPRSI